MDLWLLGWSHVPSAHFMNLVGASNGFARPLTLSVRLLESQICLSILRAFGSQYGDEESSRNVSGDDAQPGGISVPIVS